MWDFIKGLHEVRNPAIGFTGEKRLQAEERTISKNQKLDHI